MLSNFGLTLFLDAYLNMNFFNLLFLLSDSDWSLINNATLLSLLKCTATAASAIELLVST